MSLLARILFILFCPAIGWALTESHGLLGLENMTYFGRLSQDPDTGSYSSVNANYRGRTSSRRWGEAQLNAGGLVFLEGYEPLLNLREGFVASPETRQWVGAKLSVGRKLERWSEIDRMWSLGIWQPRFRWDYLHPEEQGLTGVFLEVYEADSFRFIAYGSPYFIPDQGPSVRTSEGRIVSQSPWINQPTSQVTILGRGTPVTYSIPPPDLNEIVQNPGGALMMELGSPHKGPWFRAATAYKPVNQLMLSANTNMRPGVQGPQAEAVSSLDASIQPHVAYHYVYEVTGGYQGDATGAWLSLLKDRPVQKELPQSYVSQQISPTFIFAPGFGWNFSRNDPEPGRVEVGWLRRWGGNASDKGELADPDGSFFEPRFLFENAVSVSLETPVLYSSLGGLRYRGQTVYESSGQGLLLSNSLTLQTRKAWAVFVGIDLLGQVGDADELGRKSLITRFRQNDRIHGGITYVF